MREAQAAIDALRSLWIAWGAAVVAAAGAATLLPAAGIEPFRGTLIGLPLIAVAAATLGRWGRALGARPTWRLSRSFGPPLILLVLLTLSRPALGLQATATDRLLAAGFAALLLTWAIHLGLSLRPLLGRRLPARPSALFLFLPLICFLALSPWSSAQRGPDGDEPYYLLLAHSLSHDLDLELSNNYAAGDSLRFMDRRLEPQFKDPTGPDGEIYSRHQSLFPLVLAPAYRVAGKAGALAVVAVLGALVPWTFLRLAAHYFPQAAESALLTYLALGLLSPILVYSYQFWVEIPAALLAALGLDRVRVLEANRRRQGRNLVLLALIIIALPLLKMRFLLLAGPLLLLAAFRVPSIRKPLVALGGALVVSGAALLLYNQLQFDNPLRTHHLMEITGLLRKPLSRYLTGAGGLLLDCAFGLAASAPLWLLLVPATALAVARRLRVAVDLAVVCTPYLLVLLPRLAWYGEWSPPFRYGLVLLPLAALLLVPLLELRRRTVLRLTVVGLVAATAVLMVLWIALPEWTYHFADGRSRLLDVLSARTATDVARFFPSFVRPRAANVVWALIVLPGLAAVWLPRARTRPAISRLGVSLALLSVAGLSWATARLPTTVIQAEDPYVAQQGGKLYPPQWTRMRIRYTGALNFRGAGELKAPVTPGGNSVEMALRLRTSGPPGTPASLAIYGGEQRLAERRIVTESGWRTISLGELPWAGHRTLGVRFTTDTEAGQRLSLHLDRIELGWR